MSQKATACTIALFCRGIAPKFSGNLSAFVLPLFSSGFHGFPPSPFSSKPKVDFSSINDVDDAVCLFHDMVRMQPQPYVFQFNKLLTVVVKMKHYSVALYLFDKMRQLGAPVNEITMSIAVNCYCLLNRVDFGFAILGTFFKRGWEPDATTFNTLIKGLFLVGEIAEAEKLFKKLLSEKLCEPDEIMYLIVLNGLSKAGHTLAARDLLGFFENMSCKPNVYAYNTVIDGGKISPDVWTFNILVDAFCKEGMVEEAENVLEIMMQRNICPDIITYDALIDGYCLRGQMGKAKRVLNTIADSGLKPSIISYGSLINGYCKQGRVDEAWHLFMEISCKGLQHDTVNYNTMIHGLFCKGRFADGWKLFNDMQARSVMPDLQTYTILLDGLCRTQQIAQAFSFLCMMEDTGVNPNIIAYAIVIDGLCKGGKLEIARHLFNQLPSKGLQPDTQIYSIIIGSLCRGGLTEDAKALLSEMEKSGCAPNSATYDVMIQGFLKRNELQNAMPLMEEMYKRGFLVDSSTASMLLDQLQGKGKDDILLELIKKVVPKDKDLFGKI
ncbi:UNVERIFIED_CONTAM: putative pentatricopeptide repeat-containing protein, mitochondrial [Sesamum radiatum]|uniref:Pentatricopeptide repeat-containing protein, mitochondrial n=1 Tax=Sesamum radiatum TaxID=300843 RepID=A0AAW2P3X1_SESRA